MSHIPLRPTLIMFSLLSVMSVHTPKAHASWVSHWLGLDHHSSTPTPNDQKVYTQPLITIVSAPYPTQTPVVVYAPKPLISSGSVTLPVTGPKINVIPIGLLLILFIGTALHVHSRNRLRAVIRNLDIV